MNEPTSPTAQEVLSQLNKIMDNAEFRGSPKQRQFLSYVVKEYLSDPESNIKGQTIAFAVYERGRDFDPQVDPIVRVEAGRLRRALEHYYLTAGTSDTLLVEIPKGSYKPLFNKRSPGTKAMPSFTVKESTKECSVAVLPIHNISKDRNQDYFANGLTEELTSEFSRYQELRVIASQSTMRFKDKQIKHQDIGRDLGVRFLIEGSIRTDKQNLKVMIRLIDSRTAEQIWSESYKSEVTAADLIDLQEEIAQAAVGKIADQFGSITRKLAIESRKTVPDTLQAYDAVLRFYDFECKLTKEAFESVFASLKQAVEQDPQYSLAWSMLGHLHADNHALGFVPIDSPLDLALVCAQRGLTLSPNSQFAHDAMALVYFHRNDKTLFLEHVKQVITLNPNAPYIIGVAGWHMTLWGEWDEGLSLLRKGMQLNPYYPSWFHLALYAAYYNRGEYENAFIEALKFNYPELFWDQVMRASSLAELNRHEEAKNAVEELTKLQPTFADNGRRLIGNYVKYDNLADAIIAGLKKAGLTLAP